MYVYMYVSFRMKICTVYMSSMHGCASATLADILANSGRTTFSPTTAPYEMMHPLGTTAPLLMTAPSQMMDWVTLALSSMTAPVAMRCDVMRCDGDLDRRYRLRILIVNLTFPYMRLHNLCTAANAAVYNNKALTVSVKT